MIVRRRCWCPYPNPSARGRRVQLEDVKLMANKVDPKITAEEVETLFARADASGDGTIDFEEFYEAVEHHDNSVNFDR